ncbi:hypothetical protein H1C71_013764, partial [Ictidomys tridecemlineatus]
ACFLPLQLVPLILSFYALFPEAPENTFFSPFHVTSLPSPSPSPLREVSSPLEASTFSISPPNQGAAFGEKEGGKKEGKERERKKPRGLERRGPGAASSWQR